MSRSSPAGALFHNAASKVFLVASFHLVVALLFFPGIVQAFVLPDTGQTKCYDNSQEISCPQPGQAYYGQDGSYKGVQPAYQDNGDGTVSDQVTGLMWEKTDDGTGRTWADAINYCRGRGVGGYADWRLPSYKELLSLMDMGRGGPDINPVFSVSADWDWSSTHVGASSYVAWTVSFTYGGSRFDDMGVPIPVRCVRGEALPASVYVDNGDGTVTDQSAGLMWEKDGSADGMTWSAALSWCEGRGTAGKTDWRLPNRRELESLINDLRYYPAISTVFPTPGNWYWTGTTDPAHTEYAWYVSFNSGESSANQKEDTYDTSLVRCVRGGITLPEAVTLAGVPGRPTPLTTATVTVGGVGVAAYMYKLDDGAWSAETAVADSIHLAGLAKGPHTLSVIGKDAAGNWQHINAPTTATWTVAAFGNAGAMLFLLNH